MINRLPQRFLAVRYNYVSPTLRQRAQRLVLMIWAAVAIILLVMAGRALFSLLDIDRTLLVVPPEFVVGVLALIGAYILIQRGRLDAATWMFIGLMVVPLVATTAIAVDPAAPVALFLPLVAAGVLLSRRSLFPLLVVFALALLVHAVNQSGTILPQRYVPADNALTELVNYSIALGLSAIFLLAFSGTAERIAAASFADIQQLKAAGNFGGALDETASESDILMRILELVESQLGFDLAQIYLRDSDGRFTRRLRLGLSQGARVALRASEETLITEVIVGHQPILITHDDPVRGEHLIAPARESVTLALRRGDTVFGILDVQGEHPDMFTENVIAALQNLASHAARELAQARRLEELERSVRDQEAIINRFLNQMTELQQRSQSAADTGWNRYVEGRGRGGFGFDYEGGHVLASSSLPDEIRQAVQAGEVYVEQQNGSQIVNVPIILRDTVLGAISFTMPSQRSISERQLDMLRTVANRLGSALESNRLLEQTQAQAQRERRASEIGGTLLSVTDVDSLLNLAAQNFNEALGAVHTRVVLEPGGETP